MGTLMSKIAGGVGAILACVVAVGGLELLATGGTSGLGWVLGIGAAAVLLCLPDKDLATARQTVGRAALTFVCSYVAIVVWLFLTKDGTMPDAPAFLTCTVFMAALGAVTGLGFVIVRAFYTGIVSVRRRRG